MEYPKRKRQRLQNYDYSQENAYFITMCTQDKLCLFGKTANDYIILNEAGQMVEEKLINISDTEFITLDKYVVMPNHIHAILIINRDDVLGGTGQGPFPTVSDIVRNFKTITTKLYIDGVKAMKHPPFNQKIWQKSFHDHIIRDEKGYLEICQYMDENPQKWALDKYHT